MAFAALDVVVFVNDRILLDDVIAGLPASAVAVFGGLAVGCSGWTHLRRLPSCASKTRSGFQQTTEGRVLAKYMRNPENV
jgi:hypothetical protein